MKLNTVLTYPEMPSLSKLLVLSTLFLSGALSLPVAQIEFGVGGLVPLVETIPVDNKREAEPEPEAKRSNTFGISGTPDFPFGLTEDKKREAKPTDGLTENKKRQADVIGEPYFPYGLTEDKKRQADVIGEPYFPYGLTEDKKRQADVIGEPYFPYGLTEDKKRAAAPEHEARNSLENIEKS